MSKIIRFPSVKLNDDALLNNVSIRVAPIPINGNITDNTNIKKLVERDLFQSRIGVIPINFTYPIYERYTQKELDVAHIISTKLGEMDVKTIDLTKSDDKIKPIQEIQLKQSDEPEIKPIDLTKSDVNNNLIQEIEPETIMDIDDPENLDRLVVVTIHRDPEKRILTNKINVHCMYERDLNTDNIDVTSLEMFPQQIAAKIIGRPNRKLYIKWKKTYRGSKWPSNEIKEIDYKIRVLKSLNRRLNIDENIAQLTTKREQLHKKIKINS